MVPKISRIHWKKFERFLLEVGCVLERQKGDHMVYTKPGLNRPVIIPRDKSLPEFIILNNLRTLGIGRDEYLEIIKKMKR